MKTIKFFMVAALALLTAACSNNDDAVAQQPAPEQPTRGEITITATISTDNAGTRSTLVEDGGNGLKTEWTTDDELAVLLQHDYELTDDGYDKYGYPVIEEGSKGKLMSIAKVTDASTPGKITIQFSVPASTPSATECKIVYPKWAGSIDNTNIDVNSALIYQDGTRANAPDIRFGTAYINTTEGKLYSNNSLTETALSLEPQNAIIKFKISKGISSGNMLFINEESSKFQSIVLPGSDITDNGEVFVSLPPTASGKKYDFTLFDGGKEYSKSLTLNSTLEAKYYGGSSAITLDLGSGSPVVGYPKDLASATKEDIGRLVGTDGKIYLPNTTMSSNPIGVIAYVGTDKFSENGTTVNGSPFTGHGLVLALKNATIGTNKWSKSTGQAYSTNPYVNASPYSGAITKMKGTDGASGYSITNALGSDDNYPAIKAAKEYSVTLPSGTTGWFLPTAHQWIKILESLGRLSNGMPVFSGWFDSKHSAALSLEAALIKAGDGNYDSMALNESRDYYTSTEWDEDDYVSLQIDDVSKTISFSGLEWRYRSKTDTYTTTYVRPVFAF